MLEDIPIISNAFIWIGFEFLICIIVLKISTVSHLSKPTRLPEYHARLGVTEICVSMTFLLKIWQRYIG
jgi:hypothetical protein